MLEMFFSNVSMLINQTSFYLLTSKFNIFKNSIFYFAYEDLRCELINHFSSLLINEDL